MVGANLEPQDTLGGLAWWSGSIDSSATGSMKCECMESIELLLEEGGIRGSFNRYKCVLMCNFLKYSSYYT